MGDDYPMGPIEIEATNEFAHTLTYASCWFANILCSNCLLFVSLFGVLAQRAAVSTQLLVECGPVPVQQFGIMRLIVSSLYKRVNLISFNLVEVLVGHNHVRLPGQEALNAKHPRPPNHQIFKDERRD
jgi:hypothetical protein